MTALVIVLAAIAIRVGWVLAVPTKPVGDFAMYLESAAYLRAHGALDPEFVYMPGYVLLAAAVQAAGGGWLAVKLVGALIGGLGAGVVVGIARRLWDERVAAVAGALCAVWPGGVAVASVTGTDMPAAVAIGAAVWLLVRLAPRRPGVAAAAFGAAMGIAAWARAVAVPLAAFSAVHALLARAGWRKACARGALSVAIAAAVLSPWALRNRLRYGELVLTDSHGGLTALVGALPNTDGRYSRSLNRMWQTVTGRAWLAEPHRQADRDAYALAKRWAAFEPAYAVALVATKADRLLGRERSLLYWPLYRAGVLPPELRARWDERRSALELATDAFWATLVALALAGSVIAARRRAWPALFPLPLQLALTALYALFFAEARYHLPIALLAFPAAAGALVAARDGIAARRIDGRTVALAAAAPALAFAAFFALTSVGARSLDRHRWAVAACRIDGRAQLCSWRRDDGDARAASPVAGVFDGVGLVTGPGRPTSPATVTSVELPGGRYTITARLDGFRDGAAAANEAIVSVRAANEILAVVPLGALVAPNALPVGLAAPIEHRGGALPVRLEVTAAGAAGARVWLTDLQIARR